MSRRTAAWLAWTLCGLTVVLIFWGGFLAIKNGTLDPDFSFVISHLLSAVIGGVVASRRPANVIGWLFLGSALGPALQTFARQYVFYGLPNESDALPAAQAMEWITLWTGPLGAALVFVLVPLYFPNGRPVSPRWRPVIWLVSFSLVTGIVWIMLRPGEATYDPNIDNPLGMEALRPVQGLLDSVSIAFWLGAIFVAVVSLAVRFRRSWGQERQQLKWLTYAIAIVLVWFSTNWPVAAALPNLFPLLDALVVSSIPVAAGVAILKYRLYEIDVVINRTLVYGSLTVALAAVYIVGVVSLQALLRALPGQESQLAVVASTLVIAALFNPLRRRIQGFIDRRFYRRKYDAAKTLEAFSARLRDDTDLDTLNNHLVRVVRETMQPAHVSLWLRPDANRKGEQLD